MSEAVLILDRFCGQERYSLAVARWNMYFDNEIGLTNFCIVAEAGRGRVIHDSDEDFFAEPWWELNCYVEGASSEVPAAGSQFEIPRGYAPEFDGYVTNLYYFSHEETNNNVIKVLDVECDKLLLHITGEITDPNFYDGSKPRSSLFVEAWFQRDPAAKRSLA